MRGVVLREWLVAILLVLGNLSTHSIASLSEASEPVETRRLTEKLEIHYTPKHGSWLNMGQIELSIRSRERMKDYLWTREQRTAAIAAWERSRDEQRTGIDLRFTTTDARIKLRRPYPTMQCGQTTRGRWPAE